MGDPQLLQVARPGVDIHDPRLSAIIGDMYETMHASDVTGAGRFYVLERAGHQDERSVRLGRAAARAATARGRGAPAELAGRSADGAVTAIGRVRGAFNG